MSVPLSYSKENLRACITALLSDEESGCDRRHLNELLDKLARGSNWHEALRHELSGMADLPDNAIMQHIYDEGNGEKPEPDCGYTAAVKSARELIQKISK